MLARIGRLENHRGHPAIAELMRQAAGLGILLPAFTELRPKLGDTGKRAGKEPIGHVHHLAGDPLNLASAALLAAGWGMMP